MNSRVSMTDRSTFFGRHALLVLVVVFFFVPFALRGARLAVQNMKNDVKDWLPADFPETAELEWFGQHFLGEQFIVISWEGCGVGGTDERFKLFLAKLQPEVPPEPKSDTDETAAEDPDGADAGGASNVGHCSPRWIGRCVPTATSGSARFRGRQSWPVHRGERPLQLGRAGRKVAERKRWFGHSVVLHHAGRRPVSLGRHRRDSWQPRGGQSGGRWAPPNLTGELVHSFGAEVGSWYYEHPRRLRAQLFKTVTTGPAILASLDGTRGRAGGRSRGSHASLERHAVRSRREADVSDCDAHRRGPAGSPSGPGRGMLGSRGVGCTKSPTR